MKKCKFAFLVFLMSSFTLNTYAFRFVGNGAGDAEMKTISYFETLPTWIAYCSSEGVTCVQGQNAGFWKNFGTILKNLKITELDFVSEKDFNNIYLSPSVSGTKLRITFESLYIQDKKSKPVQEIFSILINQVLKAANLPAPMTGDAILILPQFKKHPRLDVYALSFRGESRLYSPIDDMNNRLHLRSELQGMRILSETATGYLFIKRFAGDPDETRFEVFISQAEPENPQVILYPLAGE